MAILMISRSRGRHIGFIFLEIEKGPGPPITSGYAHGHRFQMYVSITNTEWVIAILMISRSRGGHIGIMFWKLLVALVPPSTSGYANGQMYVSVTNTEEVMAVLMISRSGGGHIGFLKNAIGRNFAHPSENAVLVHY